jgi:hypothetical protein
LASLYGQTCRFSPAVLPVQFPVSLAVQQEEDKTIEKIEIQAIAECVGHIRFHAYSANERFNAPVLRRDFKTVCNWILR